MKLEDNVILLRNDNYYSNLYKDNFINNFKNLIIYIKTVFP
jgi:hypothetical protein